MTTKKTRRGVSLLAAFAIAAGGFALPMAAVAADGNVSGDGVQKVQHEALINLDTNARGTLTIDKRVRTENNGTKEGNGLKDDTVTGDRLAGVTYKIEKLTAFDLTTQKGWEDLAALNGVVPAADASPRGTAQTKTTTADAATTFDNLELGAYVVTETAAPSGYTLSAPFVVTVPMTHPTELNKWNYDPIVYPKNSKTEVKKTVKDDAAPQLGDERSYTITSDIPNLADDQTLDYYAVIDEYDSRMTLKADSVVLTLDDEEKTTLAKGIDYELAEITAAFDQDGKAETANDKVKRVTAVLTETGRAKVLAARRATNNTKATKVIMTLTTTITEKIGGNGVVPNKAYVFPNKPSDNWDPKTSTTPPPDNPPSSEVVSKYGKVTITKVSSTDASKKLEGAEFEVFRCTMQNGDLINLNGENFVSGDYKTVGDPLKAFSVAADGTATAYGSTRFKTAADGTVTIDALQNNDWENGEKDTTPDAYCLVEKVAPKGYELQTRPIAFQILETNSTDANKYTLGTTVKDVPKNGGFKLPLTGAAGVGVLLTAGALLVGGSGAIAYANKRRKDQEA